jgi:hypothetical protein
MFAMKQHHHWSIDEIEHMYPWERDVFVALLSDFLKEEKERLKKENGK